MHLVREHGACVTQCRAHSRAQLWRLNWGGDTSPRGLANSFGLMANYRWGVCTVLPMNANANAHARH
jgi:hypothetical protein